MMITAFDETKMLPLLVISLFRISTDLDTANFITGVRVAFLN